MGGFSGLNALIAKKQDSAPATAAPSAPPPQAAAAPAQASSFGGLNSLIAKKTGVAPVTPDSSNPIVGTAQKAGRGLGSALGAVGNALDLPLAAVENLATGKGLGRIPEDLKTGGLSSVAENDVYFRKGSLQRTLEDESANPQQKAQAEFFLQHPWVAGAADFATEFANPSNIITGGAGKLVGTAAKISHVAQAADELQATTRIGSRFAGLRAGARDVGVNPEEAEQWGRRVINSSSKADEGAYHQAMSDFGDLTKPEQEEVVHRAQGNNTANFGEKDPEIDKRAQSVVKNIWQATRDQMLQGVIDPSKVYGKDEMFPGVFSDVGEGAPAKPPPEPSKNLPTIERTESDVSGEYKPEFQEFTNRVGPVQRYSYTKDGQPVGHVEISFPKSGVPHIEDLFTNVSQRKQGVGEAMLRDAGQKLQSLGYDRVTASPSNDTAQALNERVWGEPQEPNTLLNGNTHSDIGVNDLHSLTPQGSPAGEPTVHRGLAPKEIDAIAQYARGQKPENAEDFTPLVQERGEMLKQQLAQDEPPSKSVKFFPMAGAFNQPGRDEEYLDFLEHHTGSGGGKVSERKGTAGQNAPARTHQTLLDAQVNSKVGLRDDWSPAESYYRFLAQRSKNVELEKAMTDLMGTGLAKPAAERTAGDHFGNVADIQSTRMLGSPVLKGAAAHQHVVNFLEEVGATKGEASSFATATTALGRAAQALKPTYEASQSILRQAVISNPIVHAGWNLMGQYLAAGGDIRYLGGVNEQIAQDAERYGAVTSRGAPRSLSGGSAIALASRPVSDLNPVERVQRAAASAQEWNAKVVFDQAERRYSSALYQTYVKRGMNPAEAGNRVRQALGDYANVSNAGPDKIFKQAFFFYPWLKTLLPFWIKTGVTKPQTWNPIVQGIATNNELAGDPNAGTSNVSPFTLYTGSDKGGRPSYFSVPVVSRILTQIGDLVGGVLTNNHDEASKGFKSLLLNRLNPVVGGALSAGQSVVSGTDQPEGPLGYAPVLERLKTGVAGLGDFIPAPVKAAYDAAQVLLGHEDLKPSVIAGELVGGTGYVSTTPGQKMAASHIRGRFYRIIDNALKRGDKAMAWKGYQAMQQALEKAGLAHDQPKRNPEKADETNPNPQQVPEGAQRLEATEAPEEPPTAPEPEPETPTETSTATP